MTPQQFIEKFREAFGEAAPMPIAFWYGDTAVNADSRVPRCMIGAIRKVCEGNALTLTSETVQCGGGGLYTAFRPMPERVPLFVSETEHYKQRPEQVRAYVESLEIEITELPYLNFVRVDKLDSWEGVEAVVFFATPDVLSGLCTWAFFDNDAEDAVVTKFASGCAAVVSFATVENRKGGRRCFLGMFDPSARPLVPKDELSFAVPMSRFKEMLRTMPHSALFEHAFSVVRRRIDGLIK
ncbi:MAG: DUF169 domain-containing protein [Alistipes sp.]|nr:DUF169 domain-containing protein [Alistipes sp.]MBQ8775814.1 DUF169 domain-containing protein [Alistipes sp.]